MTLSVDLSPPRPAFLSDVSSFRSSSSKKNKNKNKSSRNANRDSIGSTSNPPSVASKSRFRMSGILTSRGSSKMNEAKAVDPNGNANANGKDVGETRNSHSEHAVPDLHVKKNVAQKQNEPPQRKQSKSIIKRFSTTFRGTKTSPSPSVPNNEKSVPVPLLTAQAKSARDAALRERGLLPPLPNLQDLSALEREQDRRMTVILPAPDTSEGQGVSAADLIKRQWAEKEKEREERETAHREESEKKGEEMKRMKSFRFGGNSPTTPSSPSAEPETTTAASVSAEPNRLPGESTSEPEPGRESEEPDASESEPGSGPAVFEPQLETLVEVDSPLPSPTPQSPREPRSPTSPTSPVISRKSSSLRLGLPATQPPSVPLPAPPVPASPTFASQALRQQTSSSSLSSSRVAGLLHPYPQPNEIPLPPSPLLQTAWGSGSASGSDPSTPSTSLGSGPFSPPIEDVLEHDGKGGEAGEGKQELEPWMLYPLPPSPMSPTAPSRDTDEQSVSNATNTNTVSSLSSLSSMRLRLRDGKMRISLEGIQGFHHTGSTSGTPVPAIETPREGSVPRPQTPTVVKAGYGFPEGTRVEEQKVVVISADGEGQEDLVESPTSFKSPISQLQLVGEAAPTDTFGSKSGSKEFDLTRWPMSPTSPMVPVSPTTASMNMTMSTSVGTSSDVFHTPPASPPLRSQSQSQSPIVSSPILRVAPADVATDDPSSTSPSVPTYTATRDGSLAPPRSPSRPRPRSRSRSRSHSRSKSRSRSPSREASSENDNDNDNDVPMTPDLEHSGDGSSGVTLSTLESALYSSSSHGHGYNHGHVHGGPRIKSDHGHAHHGGIPVIVESPEDGVYVEKKIVIGEVEDGVLDQHVAVAKAGDKIPIVADSAPDVPAEAQVAKANVNAETPASTPDAAPTSNLSLSTPTPRPRAHTTDEASPDEKPKNGTSKSERRKSLSLFGNLRRSVVGTLTRRGKSPGPTTKSGSEKQEGKNDKGFDASHLPPSPSLPVAFRAQQAQAQVQAAQANMASSVSSPAGFATSNSGVQGGLEVVGEEEILQSPQSPVSDSDGIPGSPAANTDEFGRPSTEHSPEVQRGRTLTVRGGGDGKPKVSSLSSSLSTKIKTTGVGLRNPSQNSGGGVTRAGGMARQSSRGTQGSGGGGGEPATPRVAVSPTMHSRGSILFQTNGIEDEESRRVTEVAFLY